MSAKVSGTTISLTRGDSLIIQISVNQEGKPYEVKPGDKIRFAMKKDLQDSEPLIMKQIDPQSLQLTIEPEDTKKLEFGKYWYDIELTTDDGFVGKYGIVIEDTYKGEHFAICLPYENPEDVTRKEEIDNLKDELARTDYKLYKYMDGSLSEEDYAPVKAQRQAWRDRINELEALIINPTITQEEMIKAEEAALAKKE